MVPPIYLVQKVLTHVVQCKASGTLIVPNWRSAQFWPLLFGKDSCCSNFVAHIFDFLGNQNIYVQGRNKNSIFGSKKLKVSSKVKLVTL